MKKDNIEALKSSAIVAIAMGVFVADVLFLFNKPHILSGSLIGGVVGFIMGLSATWYTEED